MRAINYLAFALVIVVLAGCAAGAPGAVKPTPTPAQVAAASEIDDPGDGPAPTATTAATAASLPTVAPATAAAIATVPPAAPPPTVSAVATEASDAATAPADPSQTSRLPAPPLAADGLSALYEGGPSSRLEVALTFDAGADRGYTAEILDLVAEYGIKVSFGMTGQYAEANPDLVQRIVDEGHMVFNHTWTHDSLTGANTDGIPMTQAELLDELERTEKVVYDLTGYQMKPYFRPPYGDIDETSRRYLAEAGYTATIMWTCDTRGWAGWAAQQIVDYCTVQLKPNEIILLHVGAGAITDLEALPAMIASFREQGYAFVTVEQMLQP